MFDIDGISMREVKDDDWEQIYALIEKVFLRKDEARFMKQLHEENKVVYAFLLERNKDVIGLIAYSRAILTTEESPDKQHDALVMAPFVIDPLWQAKSLGGEMIKCSHQILIDAGEKLCFVLGEENYYKRFGYTNEIASHYKSPYSSPYLLACKWSQNIPQAGSVKYAQAFANVIG